MNGKESLQPGLPAEPGAEVSLSSESEQKLTRRRVFSAEEIAGAKASVKETVFCGM